MARVLFILTSNGQLGASGKPTGFYWEELAVPYYTLRDAGHEVVLASVEGGRPPADPASEKPRNRGAEVERFWNDRDAMAALAATRPVSDVGPEGFDALFLPGGHGTMWDLRQTPAVGALVAGVYDQGGIVGAVCHGPGGLLGARLKSGQPIVAGRRVSGFTNVEERLIGLAGTVPFLLADALSAEGGLYEKGLVPFLPFAIRDDRLITGQNPASSTKVAELLREALAERA